MNIVEKIRFKGNRTIKYSVSRSIYRKSYDDDFVRKIEESRKQIKAGKCKSIRTEDLWK